MLKRLKIIYASIFAAGFLLAVVSLIDYILTNINLKWATFVLSVIIMALSLFGYFLVEKSSLIILTKAKKEIFKKKKSKF